MVWTMLILWILLFPLYLGLVWALSRFLCREAAHRKSHVWAAATSLALTMCIISFGVPYAHNPQDSVGVPVALGLLAIGPVLFPRIGPRARIGIGLVLGLAFTEPVVRVEYLTWRHGQPLREAMAREGSEAESDRLFSVFAWSPTQAQALRVEKDKTAYLVRFQSQGDGPWRVAGNYPPQQLLWYYGNSGWYNCPYPTSVLLVLHRARAWCG